MPKIPKSVTGHATIYQKTPFLYHSIKDLISYCTVRFSRGRWLTICVWNIPTHST
ncbi:unnamed protein product [Schistosoma mattheei]|uniref:Uncharacterized protein n=1 Tax=Schistosoma mattheei TaxID=31246 RepID=A0A3P8K518_9TREM|nr:unnamed protein product [Schistosoma mattheei]